MKTYIALLRAVNVGGTGKLPMADLKAMCVALGLNEIYVHYGEGMAQSKLKIPAAKTVQRGI